MHESQLPVTDQIDNLADILTKNPDKCIQDAGELLDHIDKKSYPFETIRVLSIQGSALYYQTRYREAADKLKEALTLSARLEAQTRDTIDWLMRTRLTLGMCRMSLSEHAKAIFDFLEVKNTALAVNDSFHYFGACIGLGGAYCDIGRYGESLELLEAVHESLNIRDDSFQKGMVKLYLGKVNVQMDNREAALGYLQEALEIFDEHTLAQTPEVLLAMAEIYLAQNDLLRCEQYLSTVLDLAKAKRIPAVEARALLVLARLEYSRESSASAITHLERSRELAVDEGIEAIEGEISRFLMELYEQAGDSCNLSSMARHIASHSRDTYLKQVLSEVQVMEISRELKTVQSGNTSLKRQYEAYHHSRTLLSTVTRLCGELASLKDPQQLLETLWTGLKEVLPLQSLNILTCTPGRSDLAAEKQVVSGKIVHRSIQIPCESKSSIEAYCARTRRNLLIGNIETEGFKYREGPVSDRENANKSWMLVPMEAQGKLLGVLVLKDLEQSAYTREDMEVISLLAIQAASVIAALQASSEAYHTSNLLKDEQERMRITSQELHNARVKIEQLAIHDDLTGLPNRHLLYERAVPMLHLAKRNKQPFAVCYIDIDNFKKVNDALGHWAGDEVLRIIGRRLSKVLRKSDLVARIGGDEFAAVFSDMKRRESITVILDKLLREFEKPIDIGKEVFTVGASIGVSFYPEDASEFSHLLNLADKAQYIAKNRGKNRYCIYSEISSRRISILQSGIS